MCTWASVALEDRIFRAVREQGRRAALDVFTLVKEEGACLLHFCGAVRTLARSGRLRPDPPRWPVAPRLNPSQLRRLGLEAVDMNGPTRRFRKLSETIVIYPDVTLGRGSAALVYRGADLRTGSLVAVKVLSPKEPPPEPFREWLRERFLQEPQLLARLDHPHIVKVVDWGESLEGPWYAMEYLEGGTLADRLGKRRRIPPDQVRTYFRALAAALAEAARHGILHRDVKPGNVFNKGIKLADFGLAKVAPAPGDPSHSITAAGAMLGTPAYVAPERAGFGPGDFRSDMYSLGATMYHAATGKLLWDLPPDDPKWGFRHLRADPVPVRTRVPGFPESLAQVIHRCLAKAPEDRYPSFEALLAALKR
jgi:serine/threonine-protein kinase